METRILTHAFALCLHIDDFATDSGAIAQDLSMDPTKYVSALFFKLICDVDGPAFFPFSLFPSTSPPRPLFAESTPCSEV